MILPALPVPEQDGANRASPSQSALVEAHDVPGTGSPKGELSDPGNYKREKAESFNVITRLFKYNFIQNHVKVDWLLTHAK